MKVFNDAEANLELVEHLATQIPTEVSAEEVIPDVIAPLLRPPASIIPPKAPPKRISLKDYRSRRVQEPSVTQPPNPSLSPVLRFPQARPLPVAEGDPRRKVPSPIIPVLPPLLPPNHSNQPLLPLSPRKLELVASVLKKVEPEGSTSASINEGPEVTVKFLDVTANDDFAAPVGRNLNDTIEEASRNFLQTVRPVKHGPVVQSGKTIQELPR